MNILSKHKIVTIAKKDEINLILSQGKRIYHKFGLIFLFNEPDQEDLKIGILVKKSCGNAVERNYIKRICRAFIREHFDLFTNTNRVIFLFNKKSRIKYRDIEREFCKKLSRNEKNLFSNN